MSTVLTRPEVPVLVHGRAPRYVRALSWALALAATAAAAATYLIPDILTGPAVTSGNARGTALVMMAVGAPLLVISMLLADRGSSRWTLIWVGSLFYLGYNSFLLLFLTPFNSLFLLYVASLSLASFGGFFLLRDLDPHAVLARLRRLPWRPLAVFVGAEVTLNALAWLRVVVPASLAPDPGSFLEGTGVATNALYVQDLAFWLPLIGLAGWWMWQRRPIGALLTGSWIAFGVLEGIGIAVDQWFGHVADPTSPVASLGAIPIAIGLAVVNAIALFFYIGPGAPAGDLPDSEGRTRV
jgi:hypothetical protein